MPTTPLTPAQLEEISGGVAVTPIRLPTEIIIGGKGGCQACCSGLPRDIFTLGAVIKPVQGL